MSRFRIRSVKPEMWQDERFGRVSRDARLLFVGLITMADDEGRLRAMPRAIVGHVFPYDDLAPGKLEKWLAELKDAGLIVRYSHENVPYIALPKWSRHQKINRASASILPAPPGTPSPEFTESSVSDHGTVTEDSRPRARERAPADQGSGSDRGSGTPPSPPKGGRQRDRHRQVDQFAEWSHRHFPGANPTNVQIVAGWARDYPQLKSKGADRLREFCQVRPDFAYLLEPTEAEAAA